MDHLRAIRDALAERDCAKAEREDRVRLVQEIADEVERRFARALLTIVEKYLKED